jgi:hypothetical protein
VYFACSVGIASAQPFTNTIIGNPSGDILNYVCRRLDGNAERISCDFVQIEFTKLSKPADLAESLAGFEKEFDVENKKEFDVENKIEMQAMFCPASQRMNAVIAGNIDVTFETIKHTDWIRAVEDYKSSPPKAQEDMKRTASNMHDLCTNPNPETALKYSRDIHEQGMRTCRQTVNKYTQTYVKVSDTLWAAESTPSGACGIVNTSKFIASKEYPMLWKHETSKVIMSKEDVGVIKCADLDESKTLYSWIGGQFLGCDYIQ